MKHTRSSRLSGVVAALVLLVAPLGAETPATPDRAAALTAAREGNWALAEPALTVLAAAEPVDVEVCTTLAQRKLAAKESKEAVRLMERAAEAQPNRADLQALLGQAISQRIGEVSQIAKSELSLDGPAPIWMIPGARSKTASPIVSGAVQEVADPTQFWRSWRGSYHDQWSTYRTSGVPIAL